jgi:class 3 adenylate cyclase/tetratricopeptide (TPR) repeat protein
MSPPDSDDHRRQLEQAIAVQESLRGTVDDAIIDATIASIKTQLAALESPAQLRKLATILFMDIADSTAIAQKMDPENVREVFDVALNQLAQPVEAHGGRVTRFMGDGFLAVFGAPVAREDDPERAIRAGLAIIAAAQELAPELEAEWNIPDFQVRVGINTGLVALGGLTEAEDTLMGAAVNLAARLESAAPSGGLLVSHDTYRHVRGIFDVEPQEPIQAKGFPEPVSVYRVLRFRPRSFYRRTRGVEGVETFMIGREWELKALQDAFEIARVDRHIQVVSLIADAGLGKSRLLYEFENWVDLQKTRACLFRGRAGRNTQRLPFGLLRNQLAFRFEIQDDDPLDVIRNKLLAGLREGLPEDVQLEMKIHFIGQLLGFAMGDHPHLKVVQDDPQQLRDRAVKYLAQYFEGLSETDLVLVLLEDIHWADDSSLDVFNQLFSQMVKRPFMVVSAARPTLYERRAHWGEGQDFHTRVDLRPLNKLDSRRLVGQILRKVEDLPDSLRELLVENAEGNPFYLEELIKILVEQGTVSKGDETWQVVHSQPEQIRIPQTLTGVLQARLDSLQKEERLMLQQASVIGRVFWDLTLTYFQKTDDKSTQPAEVSELLKVLRRREMVFRREVSSIGEAVEYIFKHDLLREVTYESVLLSLRRQYHSLAAEWLIEHAGARVNEFCGLIANHLEAANRLQQAVGYLKLAGELAVSRYANEEALSYFNRALEQDSEQDNEEQWELYAAREKVLDFLGRREEQFRDLQILQGLAVRMADIEKQAEVALRLLSYGEATRKYSNELETAEFAVDLAWQLKNRTLEGRGYLGWGKAMSLQGGDRNTALDLFEKARLIFSEIGEARLEGHACRALGFIHNQGENYPEAIRFTQRALKLARESNDRRGEGYALTNLAGNLISVGKLQEGREFLEQSLSLARDIGNRRGEAYALGSLGNTSILLGDYSQAEQVKRESLALLREVGDLRIEVYELRDLGLLASYRSDFEDALNVLEQALALADKIGNLGAASVLNAFCEVYLAIGDYETASEYGWKSFRMQTEIIGGTSALDNRAFLAEALLGEGKLQEAGRQVEEILKQNERSGDLGRSEDPPRIYLSCVKVLKALGDPRSDELLAAGYKSLRDIASNITDDVDRQSYLENVHWHHEILELWEAKKK